MTICFMSMLLSLLPGAHPNWPCWEPDAVAKPAAVAVSNVSNPATSLRLFSRSGSVSFSKS